MTHLSAAILGIIEGITEFLPISSTGHLIIADHFLKLPESEFLKSFEIAIQLGAILAAIVTYRSTILKKRMLWLTVTCAFIPTGIIGFLLHDLVKAHLIGNVTIVAAALAIGGGVLIAFEKLHDDQQATVKDAADISVRQAIMIGTAQALALIPGVSRSAATVVAGMTGGISRAAIVDFSFLLAIPTMAAATALDLLKTGSSFTSAELLSLAIGFLMSFVTAYVAIRWLLSYVKSHTFAPFGVYRIVVAIVVWALLIH